MPRTILRNFIFLTLVVLISTAAFQNTSAQTKLYDLYSDSISVDFSPDGGNIATGDSDGYVRLWKVDTWWGDIENVNIADVNVRSVELEGNVRAVVFSPNGSNI